MSNPCRPGRIPVKPALQKSALCPVRKQRKLQPRAKRGCCTPATPPKTASESRGFASIKRKTALSQLCMNPYKNGRTNPQQRTAHAAALVCVFCVPALRCPSGSQYWPISPPRPAAESASVVSSVWKHSRVLLQWTGAAHFTALAIIRWTWGLWKLGFVSWPGWK